MIFSIFFEIGLLVLGFLYVADMILDSIIDLIKAGNELEEHEKNDDQKISEIVQHMYS